MEKQKHNKTKNAQDINIHKAQEKKSSIQIYNVFIYTQAADVVMLHFDTNGTKLH